jgi:hypothetical protein
MPHHPRERIPAPVYQAHNRDSSRIGSVFHAVRFELRMYSVRCCTVVIWRTTMLTFRQDLSTARLPSMQHAFRTGPSYVLTSSFPWGGVEDFDEAARCLSYHRP